MNANELTFGIEIETVAPAELCATTLPTDQRLQIGGRHRGIQAPYLPTGWKAELDGSIMPHLPGGKQCEIVSPVLKGIDGLRQLANVLATLKAKGHRVNATCGIHVHVGWASDIPSQALARLVTIVSYLEAGLYAITGTKTRERGRFCEGLRKYGNQPAAETRCRNWRYHALNLESLWHGHKSTVEFRVFSGSLNITKVVGWVQVCLGLVERAQNGKKSPKWVPAELKGGWKKAGPGAGETERLMGYLAWGEGYAKAHGGKMYGWLPDGPVSMDAVKDQFRRLAKTYDAEE